jgi:UDP-N-acetylmuramate dehydrogenase
MKTNLADHTSLGIGGDCADFHIVTSELELITLIAQADQAKIPLAIIGAGSNLYFADHGFDGRVIKVGLLGNSYEVDACSGGMLTVAAGENWDKFVQFTLSKNLANLESLSGIPGTIGAAPVQNIGAYGHEVGEVIARVRTYDRKNKEIATLMASDLKFSYRSSLFKEEPNRFVILDVTFHLRLGENSLPVEYQELAKALEVEIGERAPVTMVRNAVLKLRDQKGMLLESGLKSAGSFFVNPILDEPTARLLPSNAPKWQFGGQMKVSAAWLIEQSGFAKGDTFGKVGISPLHTLALINLGEASAADLNAFARHIKDKVKDKFGVELSQEVLQLG